MVQHTVVHFENSHYNPPPTVSPAADNDVVELFLKYIQLGNIRLSYPPKDCDFCSAVLPTSRHREMIGSDERILIARDVKATKKLPAVWLCQSEDDIVRVY